MLPRPTGAGLSIDATGRSPQRLNDMSRCRILSSACLVLARSLSAADVPPSTSPFLPATGTATTPAPRTARWELIAIMGTREKPAVRIQNTAENAAAWLQVGESFGALKLLAADLAASTATVQVGTEQFLLPLRLGAVIPGAAATTSAPGGSGATGAIPPPLPSTGDAEADAKRAQDIAEREARMLVSDLLEIKIGRAHV